MKKKTRHSSRRSTGSSAKRSKILPYALGAAVIGGVLLLATRNASAAENPNNKPNGNNNNNNNTNPPNNNPNRFPAGTSLARVNVTTGEGSLNLRTQPSPAAGLVANYPNGTLLGIRSTGHTEQSSNAPAACSNCEWWEVFTADGKSGFMRFKDAGGHENLTRAGGPDPKAAAFAMTAGYARMGQPLKPIQSQPAIPRKVVQAHIYRDYVAGPSGANLYDAPGGRGIGYLNPGTDLEALPSAIAASNDHPLPLVVRPSRNMAVDAVYNGGELWFHVISNEFTPGGFTGRRRGWVRAEQMETVAVPGSAFLPDKPTQSQVAGYARMGQWNPYLNCGYGYGYGCYGPPMIRD